jgi:hypothetical protein
MTFKDYIKKDLNIRFNSREYKFSGRVVSARLGHVAFSTRGSRLPVFPEAKASDVVAYIKEKCRKYHSILSLAPAQKGRDEAPREDIQSILSIQ